MMLSVASQKDIEFERMYAEHSPRALAAARSVLRDETAAEDVVQEVFMTLWKQPRNFDARRGSIATYVSVMARSRAIDRLRAGKARVSARDRLADHARVVEGSAQSPASEAVIDREQSRSLVRALDTLPEQQREAVLLAYAYGMSSEQIARTASVPLGTAKSRVRLGLQKARVAYDLAA